MHLKWDNCKNQCCSGSLLITPEGIECLVAGHHYFLIVCFLNFLSFIYVLSYLSFDWLVILFYIILWLHLWKLSIVFFPSKRSLDSIHKPLFQTMTADHLHFDSQENWFHITEWWMLLTHVLCHYFPKQRSHSNTVLHPHNKKHHTVQ